MPTAALLAVFLAEVNAAGVWAEERRAFLAAQIEVESSWRTEARSQYAAGLAQFTPETWQDLAPATLPSCKGVSETDPPCSIRAQLVYMRRLEHAVRRTEDPLVLAARAYNGGLGWIRREQRLCSTIAGCNPNSAQSLDAVCIRADWACKENLAYPGKILAREPKYSELLSH